MNDAGYNCGTPDGSAGKKTKAAIKDYQSANGLNATGAIDDELLAALGIETEAPAEAPAEAQTEETKEEYTFQGIPWGASPEEAEAILVNQGFVQEGAVVNCIGPSDSAYYFHEDEHPEWDDNYWEYQSEDLGVGGVCFLDGSDLLADIGGYTPEYVKLYFLYDVDNGEIVTDSYHLTMVSIVYLPDDTSLTKELEKQLTASYGKPTKGKFVKRTVKNWIGGNDTIITLYQWYRLTDVIYAKQDDYLKAQEIQRIVEDGKAPKGNTGL